VSSVNNKSKTQVAKIPITPRYGWQKALYPSGSGVSYKAEAYNQAYNPRVIGSHLLLFASKKPLWTSSKVLKGNFMAGNK
jgi:hypothetical protein